MTEGKHIRIDKYLWAVRIYKTRSIASDECHKGRILIGNVPVKPSRTISAGDIITVRKPPVNFTYRVTDPIENRVSAKLVPDHMEDLTPEEEKAKLDFRQSGNLLHRPKGLGRPTKKERRMIDRMQDGFEEGFGE